MAKKLDAEAISTAIHELEENSRKAMLEELLEELREWKRCSDQTEDDFAAELPGVKAIIGFIEANYAI